MSNNASLPNEYTNYFELRHWDKHVSEDNFWYYDGLQHLAKLQKGKTVLEIGFGDARFLDWCRSRGLAAAGVEISDAALAKARTLGHEVFRGPFATSTLLQGRCFDVICAFDVVEHLTLPELRQLFHDTLSHLAPGGHYLLRFPNGNSPFVGPVQTADVTHRTLVSPGTIRDIVRPIGLRVEQAFNDRILPPEPLARAKRRLSYALRSVIEAIIGFAFFGRRLPLDPNVFVIVARTE